MATVHRSGDPQPPPGEGRGRRLRQPGSRARAQLHDSGSRSRWASARAAPHGRGRGGGTSVATVADAVRDAQVVSLLLPDWSAAARLRRARGPEPCRRRRRPLRARIQRPLRRIQPPAGHDVIMVAPKGPAHRPAPLHRGVRDAGARRGRAGRQRRCAPARSGLRGRDRRDPGGVIETTFVEETESDLFANRPCSAVASPS